MHGFGCWYKVLWISIGVWDGLLKICFEEIIEEKIMVGE